MNVGAAYFFGEQSWSGIEFKDLWSARMYINSQLSDAVGFNFNINRGKAVALFALVKGDETNVHLSVDFKPFDRLLIEPNLDWARSTQEITGEELYEGYITRTRLRYQASKEISLRLVVQYNDFRQRWDIDPLLTYRISPFSVFYVGSSYDYAELSSSLNEPTQWTMSSRQFFMKLQYLFQI